MTDPTTAVDRCPSCLCENCGGPLSAHTATGCGCEDCALSFTDQCSLGEFQPPERIDLIARQIGPLLSAHLNPEALRRCYAVAHAAHHALHDYDEEADRA